MIKIEGKLGEWKEFDKKTPIGELLGGKAQEVAVEIIYQSKDGTHMAISMKHKDYIQDEGESAETTGGANAK